MRMIEDTSEVHFYDECYGSEDVSFVDVHAICGEDKENCFKDFNTKWHIVYEFNGVVLLFLSLSYASVAFGSFIYYARLIGAGCTVFWNCCHIAALIITASYRYSQQGRLCALSEQPSSYIGEGEFSDDWNYNDDAVRMTNLWGLQLLTFALICCIGVFPLRVPQQPSDGNGKNKRRSIARRNEGVAHIP